MYCAGKIGANQLSSMNIFYVLCKFWGVKKISIYQNLRSLGHFQYSKLNCCNVFPIFICCWMSILHCSYLMHSHLQAFTYISEPEEIGIYSIFLPHGTWQYLNNEKYSSSWLKKLCCTRAAAAAVSSWQIKLIREQRSIAPLLYCHIVIEAKFHSWAILI